MQEPLPEDRRRSDVRLYGPHAAAIATIMGTMLAAVLLIWLNYQAMGRPDLARRAGWIGIGLQVLMLGVGALMPNNFALAMAMLFVQVAAAFWGTRFLQGDAIAWHLERGGTLHSPWRAMGLGLLVGFAIFFVLVLALTVLGTTGAVKVPAA